MADRLAELQDAVEAFVAERDWAQFHTPKNLAMGVAIEAAEIMEHFHWCTGEESRALAPEKRAQVANEIGDVLIYLLRLGARSTSMSWPRRRTSSRRTARNIRSRRRRDARRSTSISTDRAAALQNHDPDQSRHAFPWHIGARSPGAGAYLEGDCSMKSIAAVLMTLWRASPSRRKRRPPCNRPTTPCTCTPAPPKPPTSGT